VTCLGWHFETIKTDATGAVNVGMIDWSDKLNVWRLKWIPTIHTAHTMYIYSMLCTHCCFIANNFLRHLWT